MESETAKAAVEAALSQTNFSAYDWVIVGAYLLISVFIGLKVKKYATSMSTYVTAGRSLGTCLGIATMTGTELGLITVMYSAQKGFTGGFAAFHIATVAGIVTFVIGFTGFVVYRLRAMEVLTIPEFYEKRFGRNTRIVGGIMLAFGGILNMGLFLKVGSMFIVGITGMPQDGSALPAVMITLLTLVLIYTVLGGMLSVVLTDYIQFVVLSFGLLITCIIAISKLGWSNIFETVEKVMGQPGFDPTVEGAGFGVEYMVWMALIGMVSCAIWPTAVARALAADSPETVKKQYMWSSLSFLIRFLIPYFWGICALVYFKTQAPDLDELFLGDGENMNNLYAMPVFLGRILPVGLIGIISAAMIAAFMSTHDSYLLCWSSVITQDIVAPLMGDKITAKGRITMTRMIIVVIGLYILYWGLVYEGSEDIWDYMAVTGAIYFTGAVALLVGGLYWKGASSTGAMLALIAGCSAVLGLTPVQRSLRDILPGSVGSMPVTEIGKAHITVKDANFTPDSLVGGKLHIISNGEWQEVKVVSNSKSRIGVKPWGSKFTPKEGDEFSYYIGIPGTRVGLLTVAFTIIVFFAGSLAVPDRSPPSESGGDTSRQEPTGEDSAAETANTDEEGGDA
ncbi:MAG: sodium:solute symporter family protein [Planctomycetota bacterium]|jgi:SSS family solute:Na+ symporter|nr:sodium:solute symporter family protein [Planctomycetota bacterium]MDP7128940.1 sodium:solute symporter family protein [Planctomycetota bacterium]MDP7251194.1 sodium:solute symporter family protein [Planctomycetota bacterium]